MDKDLSLRNFANISQEYNSSNFKNIDDIEFKEINEVSLFDEDKEKINEELFTKEGFIDNLYENSPYDKSKYSKEELALVYDELAKFSNDDEQISENELKLLASLGEEGDKNTIDKSDIKVILTNLNKSESKDIKTILKNDERIKEDENGNKYVEVELWNNSENANDCLSNIVKNSYNLEQMGINEHSKEYNNLLTAVMNANTDIYGTEDESVRPTAGGIGRENTVLYNGDKIKLPEFEYKKPDDEVKEKKEEFQYGDKNNDSKITADDFDNNEALVELAEKQGWLNEDWNSNSEAVNLLLKHVNPNKDVTKTIDDIKKQVIENADMQNYSEVTSALQIASPEELFGEENIEYSTMYRDGGSIRIDLKDGTNMFQHNQMGLSENERGKWYILKADGTAEYYYKDGTKNTGLNLGTWKIVDLAEERIEKLPNNDKNIIKDFISDVHKNIGAYLYPGGILPPNYTYEDPKKLEDTIAEFKETNPNIKEEALNLAKTILKYYIKIAQELENNKD